MIWWTTARSTAVTRTVIIKLKLVLSSPIYMYAFHSLFHNYRDSSVLAEVFVTASTSIATTSAPRSCSITSNSFKLASVPRSASRSSSSLPLLCCGSASAFRREPMERKKRLAEVTLASKSSTSRCFCCLYCSISFSASVRASLARCARSVCQSKFVRVSLKFLSSSFSATKVYMHTFAC
jgi:membrane protein YdbS with pleckstrin-like domain